MDNQFNASNKPYTASSKNNFAVVSLILGICSLILMCTGIFSFPAGALGILFAILSRRRSKFDGTAVTGIVLSCTGFISSLFLIIMSTSLMIASHTNEAVADMLDTTFEQAYGMDFNEFFENTTGVDFDEMMDSFNF